MKTKKIFVTGSSGLIGSEVCIYFGKRGFKVEGLDNNQRIAVIPLPLSARVCREKFKLDANI